VNKSKFKKVRSGSILVWGSNLAWRYILENTVFYV